jgi:hypothetical protein
MGAEMPLYVGVWSGPSEASFYAELEKVSKKEKELKDYPEVTAKAYASVRKTEMKTGWLRPDLSVLPKK